MPADVSAGRHAQQSIRKGVTQHVRVGMPQQPSVERNVYAAQYQPPPLGETMYIVSLADANAFSLSPFSPEQRLRDLQILRRGDLDVFVRSPENMHRMAHPLH